jgi:hypothetical protein
MSRIHKLYYDNFVCLLHICSFTEIVPDLPIGYIGVNKHKNL